MIDWPVDERSDGGSSLGVGFGESNANTIASGLGSRSPSWWMMVAFIDLLCLLLVRAMD